MDRRQASLGLAGFFLAAPGIFQPVAAQTPEETFGDMPTAWLPFSKEGQLIGPAPALMQDPTITDFVIVSHGWNTDRPGAMRFYLPLLQGVTAAWRNAPQQIAGRKYAALLVQWPSKQFGSERTAAATVSSRSRVAARDLTESDLRQRIENFAAYSGADPTLLMERAQAVIQGNLQEADCAAFMRELLNTFASTDSELAADLARYAPENAQAMLSELSGDRRFRFARGIARAQGVGTELRGRDRGIFSGLCSALNTCTFFTMKGRAGDVGRGIAQQVLAPLAQSPAARVHLVGHSFGARVVTAAAHYARDGAKLRSLNMLQGAFSQNALSPDGAFAGAHRKVAGPTLITHTHNDSAVTVWYAIASHASGDTSRSLGGVDDPFGAIGANGAQGISSDLASPAATCMTDPIVFTPGKVHNMNCDRCITDNRGLSAHMNVTNARITRILATALIS